MMNLYRHQTQRSFLTYRTSKCGLFSTAKGKASNIGYRPNHVLNFGKNQFLDVYRQGNNVFVKYKVGHAVLTMFSVYSLVQAYRKNKKFRGFLLWMPLTIILLWMSRRNIQKFNPVYSIHLYPDGKHIEMRSFH